MDNIVFLEITSYKKENGINRISNSITVTDKKDFSLKLSSDKKSIPDLELGKDDYIVIIRYYRNDYAINNEEPEILCIKEPKNKKAVDKNFRGKMAVELMESLYRSSEFLTKQIKDNNRSHAHNQSGRRQIPTFCKLSKEQICF